MEYQGKSILILGLGRSGLGAARALKRHGAKLRISDKGSRDALQKYALEAESEGIELVLGAHPEELLERCELIVLSPGIPGTIPILKAARAKGIAIWSEIELAFRLAPRHWLGVTGTNGKTTTTSLLEAIWKESGRPYLCGGNIGQALADQVEALDPQGQVIAELSSFQLEAVDAFHAQVAVVTNLTPDHLDRYPNMAAYAAAKARIFERQGKEDFLVLNGMDSHLKAYADAAASQVLYFSRSEAPSQGAWIEEGQIKLRLPKRETETLMPLAGLALRGPHNQENALAAALAARAAGIALAPIAAALQSFQGVEHRLEFCGEVEGVRFVNDSKATNVDSVEKALQSFQEPLHLILGGRDKEGDFSRLAALVKSRVKRLYLIGEAAAKIEGQLGSLKPYVRLDSLEAAVREAARNASRGEWVLLSPGCASFDMFQNYEHRGRVFKAAVQALVKEGGRV